MAQCAEKLPQRQLNGASLRSRVTQQHLQMQEVHVNMLSQCGADWPGTHASARHQDHYNQPHRPAAAAATVSALCIITRCAEHKVHLFVKIVTVASEAQAGQRPANVPVLVHVHIALQRVGGGPAACGRQLLEVQIRDSQPSRT